MPHDKVTIEEFKLYICGLYYAIAEHRGDRVFLFNTIKDYLMFRG